MGKFFQSQVKPWLWIKYSDDGKTAIVRGKCMVSQELVEIKIQNAQGLYRYLNQGEHVQNALPELSADEREFLISGISGEAYDIITQEPEDEDDGQEQQQEHQEVRGRNVLPPS